MNPLLQPSEVRLADVVTNCLQEISDAVERAEQLVLPPPPEVPYLEAHLGNTPAGRTHASAAAWLAAREECFRWGHASNTAVSWFGPAPRGGRGGIFFWSRSVVVLFGRGHGNRVRSLLARGPVLLCPYWAFPRGLLLFPSGVEGSFPPADAPAGPPASRVEQITVRLQALHPVLRWWNPQSDVHAGVEAEALGLGLSQLERELPVLP